ncbi:MAG: baseplate J/gp47 family protein [Dehalococcoidia bacterium]|nr:baseplate J/gp47 family protein [Dehalococcoidia bacterium]
MRRLLRHAEETGRVIAVATGSRALADRARQAGLPVARRPRHVRWDAGGRYVIRLGPLSIVAPAIGRFVQVAIIAGIAALALFLALFLAPSATVVAYPPTETLAETVTITAIRDLDAPDYDARRLPSVAVSASRSYTLAVPATGTVRVGVGYARATVTITNPTSADVVVTAGTVLLAAPDFLDFELEADVIVPRNGTASAAVIARQPGERYNLPAGSITGWFDERYRFLAVTNPEPAAGGTSEPRPAPSEADVIAIRQLAASLADSDAVREDLAAARPRDAVFLRTAFASAKPGTPRPAIGTPSPALLLDVTVEVTALAVTESVLRELALRALVPPGSRGELITETIRASETGASSYNAEADAFTTSLRLSAEFAHGVTAADVKAAVKGKRPSEARSTLRERYAIDEADVRVVPGWAPFLPRFGMRLDVRLASREGQPAAGTLPATRE